MTTKLNTKILEDWQHVDPNNWRQLVQSILEVFFATVPRQFQELNDAVEAKNWTSVRSIAHKLKSACGNVGADYGASILDKIEMSKDSNSEDIEVLAEQFRPVFKQAVEELEAYQKTFTQV